MTGKLTTLLLCLAGAALLVAATPQKKDVKKAEAVEPQTATVKVSNFKFEPKTLTIKVGSTVTWTVDGGSHTVVSDGGVSTCPLARRELLLHQSGRGSWVVRSQSNSATRQDQLQMPRRLERGDRSITAHEADQHTFD